MSMRTVVEFNHDFAGDFQNHPEILTLLREAMRSGNKESWEPLKRFGITQITMIHHSYDRKVVIDVVGTSLEIPFG